MIGLLNSVPFYCLILCACNIMFMHLPMTPCVKNKMTLAFHFPQGILRILVKWGLHISGGDLAERNQRHKHKAFKILPCGRDKGQDGMKIEQLSCLHTISFFLILFRVFFFYPFKDFRHLIHVYDNQLGNTWPPKWDHMKKSLGEVHTEW